MGTFDYRIVLGHSRPMPIVYVGVIGPTRVLTVDALVDSGADNCVFHRDVLTTCGVSLTDYRRQEIDFGGSRESGLVGPLWLLLDGRKISVRALIVNSFRFEWALLGRESVFARYNEVAFVEKALTPRVEFRGG